MERTILCWVAGRAATMVKTALSGIAVLRFLYLREIAPSAGCGASVFDRREIE